MSHADPLGTFAHKIDAQFFHAIGRAHVLAVVRHLLQHGQWQHVFSVIASPSGRFTKGSRAA
jgi:hypothetical protein